MSTEIIVIRHGETAWNAEGRIQGHLDIPLNEAGLGQAEALGRRLGAERFAAVYSSDLKRAAATASSIATQTGQRVVHDVRLRERHLGVLQGLTRDEAMRRHPSAWESFRRRVPDENLDGGESLQDFARRVRHFLDAVSSRHAGEHVAIVTHGGVLDAMYRLAAGRALEAPRDFPLLNAAVNRLTFDGVWHLKAWGDVTHLAGVVRSGSRVESDFIDHAEVPR